jgi:hypothetical protein
MADARRPGRPPIDPRLRKDASVIVRVTSAQYDAAHRRASRDRVSVPEVIRRAVTAAWRHDDDDDDD